MFFCKEGFLLANKVVCLQTRICAHKSAFFMKVRFPAYAIRVFIAQTAFPVRKASVRLAENEELIADAP